ncbi:1-deoxy-D-xylulose-5-phosphate synthase [Catenulispora pinisilvae]|uniref:1-deoxy-D-xylulose-5-phosphate synthase n=1 Tax=Catenulispora pinisilvae TaxID=2705253 RepID=UPI0018926831|nr:1-deoxy-D-xylulose-5-phosphate synthase [Catenulispora pinisilvae]
MRTTAKSSSSSSSPAPRRPSAAPVLDRVRSPEDLAGLGTAELAELAAQIRGFLIEKVCATGGHLGVNLGVVELTIALHRAFRSPRDALLFDTGHQSYVHKILTGRAPGFDTLRTSGGLSGYPCRAESEHDWIENSHASTALSYADGLAKAFQLRGELADGSADPAGRHVVPVIGDGAMTGGLAWEGLNNLAGATDRPVVIVLNDNGRAYAPTIGGIATHLGGLRSEPRAQHLFGELGLAYLGPVDGHDIAATEQALRAAAALGRPALVHVITTKGRGFSPAECDEADRMHAVGVVDPHTGIPAKPPKKSWTEVFGEQMAAIGEQRPDVVGVSAAMVLPVGLGEFARRFPERVFDVGIAEQHAVCSSAGLAAGGLHPVVCVYSTFLNRAFDQVVMDVALHKAGVTFVLDRAGVTGPDGASHHGMWDSAILSVVPGLRLAAPRDPARLAELLREAVAVDDAPTVIRFPKADAGPDIEAHARMNGVDILYRAAGRPLDVLIVAAGVTAKACLAAAEELDRLGIGATVVDPRWILPVNPHLTHLADRHRLVVTVEDGVRSAGMGAALAQACADAMSTTPVRVMGLPREFLAAGTRQEILESSGLGVRDIVTTAVDGLRAGPHIPIPDLPGLPGLSEISEIPEFPEIPEIPEITAIPEIPQVVSKANGSAKRADRRAL